jgi:hypothetical protein
MMIDEKEKKVFCKFVPIIMERSVEFLSRRNRDIAPVDRDRDKVLEIFFHQ